MNAPTEPTVFLDAATIRAQFAQKCHAGLRAREAAYALGLSEGAAIAAHVHVQDAFLSAQRLRAEWVALLQALENCGVVMALTRNESTVHEKHGVYRNVSATGPVGLALTREIDLRLFFNHWHVGYAVSEPATQAGRAARRSLQFFDATGTAVHKIYAREATDVQAWDALVERFAGAELALPSFTPAPAPAVVLDDAQIDVPGLTQAWASMQDTHEFFDMLRRFKVERQQAFRLVPQFCQALSREAVTHLLHSAAADTVPIMVFVGNAGCIQIHTGTVQNIQPLQAAGGVRWINVLDEGFNLHLRTDLTQQVWLVQKPTADGVVTSVEVFDSAGDTMAMFFGERKPGQPELASWRSLLEQLPRQGQSVEVV